MMILSAVIKYLYMDDVSRKDLNLVPYGPLLRFKFCCNGD